ncbi:MAG: radical SAM protein, partial [Bacteroidota bacterium]
GNTDCYQPAERKFKLTRKCLEVFLKYKHPVGIITKNALILRDLDILKSLAKQNLIVINFSITTVDEKTRRVLEPRTASVKRRLKTIKTLADSGIPVRVMLAPIIPGINSHEILKMAKTVSDHGAMAIGHTIVRLNGAVGHIFTDWVQKTIPDKASKILNQIKSCHGNSLNESRFGVRMRGEGPIAEHINHLAALAKRRYFKENKLPKLNTELFNPCPNGQLKLF